MSRYAVYALLLAAPAWAQPPEYPNTSAMGSTDTHAAWYKQCLAVQAAQPPARDLPPEKDLHALRSCGAEEQYYDTRQKSNPRQGDWERVRHCAFAEHDAGVLMMLYENGYGVSRNPELALKYACSLPAAPAEMDGRVAHLQERVHHHEPAVFDLCDDITSGFMGGYCANIQDRADTKVRTARLKAILKTWTPAQQAQAAQLQQALEQFAARRSDQETDMSGSMRSGMMIEARSAELEQFARDLEDAEKGKLPRFTPQQFQQLDKKLNQVFQRVMAQPPAEEGRSSLGWGTVTKEGVRTTQRAWLAYRDAWVALGAARYPAVAPHVWKALLTQRRIDQLAEFDS